MRLQKHLLDLVLPKKSGGGIGFMNFRMLRLIIHKSYLYKNLSSFWFFGRCVLRIWSWRCLQSQTEPKKHVQTMEWVKTLALFRSHQNTWKIWCKHIIYTNIFIYIYIVHMVFPNVLNFIFWPNATSLDLSSFLLLGPATKWILI